LNTLKAASLDEARRLIDKLKIRDIPKHGSWVNMAEIELSVLGRQCLSRRIRSHPGHTMTWHGTVNIRCSSDSCGISEQTLLVEHFLRSKKTIHPELLNAN